MSAYVVEVSYHDYDQDTETDLLGPFRSQAAAQAYAAKLRAVIPAPPESAEGLIMVRARLVQPPRIRPVTREARQFWANITADAQS